MRNHIFLFATLLAATLVVCIWFAGVAPNAPFGYDEADYMYAGTRGFAANWLDRNAMSMPAYIRNGLELAHNKSLARKMSAEVRASDDLSFYRHYHGPVYAFWIALWHDFGARENSTYRAAGLVVQAAGAIAVFWLFILAFPESPLAAGLVAGLMFVMNRTLLLASTMITQHLAYSFFACLALFMTAFYLRSRDTRYFYAGAVFLGWSFASVEISFVLIGVCAASIILLDWSDGWKKLAGLMARGAVWFLAALFVIWPVGVVKFDALKGYAYLAYMALTRKTFSPIGPRELWMLKFRTAPFELVPPLLFGIAAMVYWKRMESRRALTPFLLYSLAFFAVTMVVTLPFVYYHCSLMMSLAVVSGAIFGELWKRTGVALRAASLAVVTATLVCADISFYHDMQNALAESPRPATIALDYLNAHPPGDKKILVPWEEVPTLHYYRPGAKVLGYDATGGVEALRAANLLDSPFELYCPAAFCRQVEAQMAEHIVAKDRLGPAGAQPDAWYAITAKP